MHINDAAGPITCLSWIPCQGEQDNANSEKESKAVNETPFKQYEDGGSDDLWSFLTKLPSLSKAYSYNPSGVEDTEDCQKLYYGESLSLLVAGTKEGYISFYMNGFLHCTKVDMNGNIGGPNHLSGYVK